VVALDGGLVRGVKRCGVGAGGWLCDGIDSRECGRDAAEGGWDGYCRLDQVRLAVEAAVDGDASLAHSGPQAVWSCVEDVHVRGRGCCQGGWVSLVDLDGWRKFATLDSIVHTYLQYSTAGWSGSEVKCLPDRREEGWAVPPQATVRITHKLVADVYV